MLHETSPICILADVTSIFLVDSSLWTDFFVKNIDSLDFKSITSSCNDSVCKNLSDSETFDPAPQLLSNIYTSGSTGTPKGVKIRHTTAVNRIAWQCEVFPFDNQDVGCLKTSLLFVDSIVEIFGVILKPVSLVVGKRCIASNVKEFLSLLDSH